MIDLRPNPHRARWRDGIAPTDVNGLIQARIDGKLSRRQLIRRAAALGLAAPAGAIALHATSDHAFGAPRPGETRVGSRRAAPLPVTGPTAPGGAVQTGGTLVCGVRQEPETLHPWRTEAYPTHDITSSVMEGLLRYDSDRQLQPALAEGFEISPDFLVYTFRLRQGVRWHDGTDFTAQDVIASWRMIMDAGFGAFNQIGWDKVVEVRAEDQNVVFVTLEPYAPFLSYVAGATAICPASALAAGQQVFTEQFGQTPIGTGPLRVGAWTRGQQIVLERHAEYWGGAPALERVIVRFLPDDATQIAQLRTGEIQMAGGAGALDAAGVDEALAIEDVLVLEHQTLGWAHLDLKQVDFLRETRVRQALDFATPAQQIIDGLLQGRAIRAIGDVAPGTPFFNDQIQPRPYDLEQARTLLDEADLVPNEDGVRGRDGRQLAIELWGIAGSSQTEQICQAIAASWNQIGVKTDIFFEDAATIWGPQGYQFTDRMTAGFSTWFNANDPDDMFYWHSRFIPTSPTGSGGNLPAYFFPYGFQAEIDDLTLRAAAEPAPDLRQQLYFEIQELLHEEVPVIFLYWGKTFPAVTPKLGGYWPSPYTRLLWNVRDWYLTQ